MRVPFVVSALTAVLLVASPLVARAETCPDVPDEEVALRRSMAKEWFAKAEESEASGDRQSAIRRYACSLGLAPHPSTAYNLGAVAEKSGDLSAALDGFRAYLKLAPEATDRPAIEARLVALEAKATELRKQMAPKTAPESPLAATAAPAAPPPGAPATIPAAPPPANAGGGRQKHLAGWITGGGAVALVGAGVVFNVVARSKMNTCYSEFKAATPGALSRCDEAKPLAYTSYTLFAAASVAAIVSGALLLSSPESASANQPAEVAFAPALVPGGAALFATGRF